MSKGFEYLLEESIQMVKKSMKKYLPLLLVGEVQIKTT